MSQLDLLSQGESKYESLDELIKKMKRMKSDPLADAGTNIVISRGNPDAKLMIVGEAPGPQENIQGKPFVGKSGQLLDQILQAAEFNPETDVFITNSVFRMPPGEEEKHSVSRPIKRSSTTAPMLLRSFVSSTLLLFC